MGRFDFIAAYLLAIRKNGTLYAGSTADLTAERPGRPAFSIYGRTCVSKDRGERRIPS